MLLTDCNHHEAGAYLPGKSVLSGSLPYLVIQDSETYLSRITTEDGVDWWIMKNLTGVEVDTIGGRSDWLINWADFPRVFSGEQGMLALALRYTSSAKNAYTIDYYIKTHDQTSWVDYGALPDDSTMTEHGFASATAYQSGWLIVWLDGRNTAKGGFTGLRSAEVLPDGQILNQQWVDSTVCDCCQTAIAVLANGPQVVYRDRTKEEVRDIYSSNYTNGEWSEPKVVSEDHWKINGCPVNGPQIAGYGEQSAIGWFSAANDRPEVKMMLAKRPGPQLLDSVTTLGKVRMTSMNEAGFAIVWVGLLEQVPHLNLRWFDWDGKEQRAWTIPNPNGSKAGGFPAVAYLDHDIYLAWTSPGIGADSVQLLTLPIYGAR